jgi:hypothetical protein
MPGEGRIEWADEQAISIGQFNNILNQYLGWAELAIPRLRRRDLRYTAMMLRAQNGASSSEIADWLGMPLRTARDSLQKLRQQVITEERLEAAQRAKEKGPFERKHVGAQEGNLLNLRHGFYAHRLPSEEAGQATRAPMGLEAAITNLEAVMERTLRMTLENGSVAEQLRLLDVYSQATMRLANAQRIQMGLQAGKKSEFEEAAMAAILEVAKEWE